MYIGEIAPARSRGVFTTLSELSLTVGILVLLALGSIPGVHYYQLALVLIGIVALFMSMVLWIPETPRWLLLHSKDHQRQAVAAMRYLRGPKYLKIDQEIKDIKSNIPKKTPSFCEVTRQLLCERSTLVPFLLLFFLYGYQLASGISVLNSYTGNIFLNIGVPFPNVTAAFTFGGVKVPTVIVAVILVEFAGRKLLLAISSFGMFLASLLLSMHFYFTRPSLCNNSTVLEFAVDSSVDCNPHLYPVAIVAIMILSISFSSGLGPVPWVLLSEYLPLNVRGLAGGIAGTAAWISAAIVTGTFLTFSEALGAWTAWWTLTCINFVGFLVIVVFFVETKGKKLEEVKELFATRKLCCSVLSFKKKQRQ